DVCEKARRRQPASDRPFRRRRLGYALTRPAGVFRAGDADHLELGRNPVEHFADAVADGMKRPSAAWTGWPIHIDDDILAQQVSWECLARWRYIRSGGRR